MALPDLSITNLRGGQNDTDPQPALPENQCAVALNVEWFNSMVAERRAGCDTIDISALTLTGQTACVHVSEWLPTNSYLNPELFAVFAAPASGSVVPVAARRDGSVSGVPVWTSITIPGGSAISTAIPDIYNIRTQALNAKLFIAYNSGNNRLHLWDGTNWRVTGLAQPGPPTVSSVGVGTVNGLRYYRVRVAQITGGKTIRLSEPSTSVSITPVNADHVHIVQGTLPGEGETSWIVEASPDNANFYQIATVAIATTSFDDTTVSPLSFASNGVLSPAIGAYLTQPSFRFVAADGDRLVAAGNWNDATLGCSVYWSPAGEDPGLGNDERLPIVTTGGLAITTQLILDNYAGGRITGLSNAINGNLYAFKYGRIYMLAKTQDATLAYNYITISTSRGAIEGSVFEGADESGSACVYFCDPTYGPSRIGPGGLMTLEGLRNTWKRVNLEAQHVVAAGVYYKYKRQAHWWLAADGADEPTLKIVCQTNNLKWEEQSAVEGGWSLANGPIATALQVCTYTEWVIESDGSVSLSQRPFIALNGPKIARTDVNTTDMGTAYNAKLVTRPYLQTGILNWWGSMNLALLATANAGKSVVIRLIRDFGIETTPPFTISLTPQANEAYIIGVLDSLVMSHAKAIQIQISDT